MVIKKITGLMCPHCGMRQLMLMKRDWVFENDILEHKWMSSEQQSANDEWVFEEADHFFFVSPTQHFLRHLQRMVLPIKESLSLWACNLMQIRATDGQMSAVMVLVQLKQVRGVTQIPLLIKILGTDESLHWSYSIWMPLAKKYSR